MEKLQRMDRECSAGSKKTNKCNQIKLFKQPANKQETAQNGMNYFSLKKNNSIIYANFKAQRNSQNRRQSNCLHPGQVQVPPLGTGTGYTRASFWDDPWGGGVTPGVTPGGRENITALHGSLHSHFKNQHA